MDPYVVDWLNLAVRWMHFIFGAAWIGTSFYFYWLNNSLRVTVSEVESGTSEHIPLSSTASLLYAQARSVLHRASGDARRAACNGVRRTCDSCSDPCNALPPASLARLTLTLAYPPDITASATDTSWGRWGLSMLTPAASAVSRVV